LSSIKHTPNGNTTALGHKKSASLTLPTSQAKTVRTTLIGSNTVNLGKFPQNGPSSPTTPTKPVRHSLRPSLNPNGGVTKNVLKDRKVTKTPPTTPIIPLHPLQNHFLNGNSVEEKLVDDLNNQINLSKIN
jgi:hypothetical protein